jgi:hypothetical protein
MIVDIGSKTEPLTSKQLQVQQSHRNELSSSPLGGLDRHARGRILRLPYRLEGGSHSLRKKALPIAYSNPP